MVFDPQLSCDSAVPQWHGCDDSVEDFAQRYSEVQPNGVRWRCSGENSIIEVNIIICPIFNDIKQSKLYITCLIECHTIISFNKSIF